MVTPFLRMRNLIFLGLLALATPCFAQATRGGGFLDPQRPAENRRFSALVIGIDYKQEKPAKPADSDDTKPPKELGNAEKDAAAFHKMLTECYDFNKSPQKVAGSKTPGLLIGEEATKSNIESHVQKLLGQGSNIKPDDYVLFYFAGHGRLRNHPDGKKKDGFILPSDAHGFAEGVDPNDATWSSAVEMAWIVNEIVNHCPARHKLLILDCCHSGAIAGDSSTKVAVYEHGKIMTEFDVRHDSLGISNDPVVQAITATRTSEEAADGKNENSPFTEALLKTMQSIPRRQGKHPISVTQIFQTMQFFLSDTLLPSQTPTCIWLGPDRGDFQFFPNAEHEFLEIADKQDNDREQKMLLAMVPGNFGNWWFDETPWFIPSLRLEIVKEVDQTRGTSLDLITKDSLRGAASKALKDLSREVGENPAALQRIKHLRWLLEPAGTKTFQEVLLDIERELKSSLLKDPAPHEIGPLAADLHLLAVLRHKLNSSGETTEKTGEAGAEGTGMEMNAADVYEKALERYEEIGKTNWEYRPLEAMCHADYAHLLKQNRKFAQADRQYRLAHAMYYAQSPEPFRIFVLCQQAEALRALGLWTVSTDLLRQAEDITKRITPEDGAPKPAIIGQFHRARAWAYMEQWEIKKAMADFEDASKVFETLKKDDPTAQAAYFHAQHGLAMAERFQGRTEKALIRYRGLTKDIAQELRGLGESAALSANFGEVRVLLAERLVNSLERQADCNLFSAPPDFAEAADDYRRAIRYCAQLSADRMDTQKVRMLCKRALALAMPGPSQDVELAAQVLEDANALEVANDPVLEFHKSVASNLVEFSSSFQAEQRGNDDFFDRNSGGEGKREMAHAAVAGSLNSLRKAIDKKMRSSTLINRDELESLMFATSVLIQLSVENQGTRTRSETLSDIELLTDFCRMASREAKQDADLLGYLRPSYDVAIGALIASKPKQSKELIELVWESQHGEPYDKPEKISPVLVLYATNEKCYFMLDVPHGTSQVICMQDVDLDSLIGACNPNKAKLRLPNELRKELVVLNEPVDIHWYDPVHIKPYRMDHSGAAIDEKLVGTTLRFPFDVGGLLVRDERLTAQTGAPALGPDAIKSAPAAGVIEPGISTSGP